MTITIKSKNWIELDKEITGINGEKGSAPTFPKRHFWLMLPEFGFEVDLTYDNYTYDKENNRILFAVGTHPLETNNSKTIKRQTASMWQHKNKDGHVTLPTWVMTDDGFKEIQLTEKDILPDGAVAQNFNVPEFIDATQDMNRI
jgi:hypothetical protein